MEPAALFTHVNDSIRTLATNNGLPTETWAFYCECPDVGCHALVSLSLVEFDRRRSASPPRPILAAHEPADSY